MARTKVTCLRAETLVNLSRDTIAALSQLQHTRTQLGELRAALSQLFWSCDSSAIRVTVLTALGAPPPTDSPTEPQAMISWAPAPNGLPLPAIASDAPRVSVTQRAAG